MKFFKKIISFTIFIGFLFTCIVGGYSYKYGLILADFPPPKFTSSFSFNDKLEFSRNKKADILSIGSSMTLNNLSSKIVVDRFNSTSYLNLSSWGIKLKTDFDLLKIQTKIHKPRFLFLASNIIDFTAREKDELDEDECDNQKVFSYLTSSNSVIYHLEWFNLKYYFNGSLLKKGYKSGRNFSLTLKYDQYGGTQIDPKNFEYQMGRWNNSFIKSPEEKYYLYLDSITKYCKQRDIKVLFFQSPTRESLLNKKDKIILQNHCGKVNKIVSQSGGYFVNSNEKSWNDSLYIDGIHLNQNGADYFTSYCLDKIPLKTLLNKY